jgi:hypothetical protein
MQNLFGCHIVVKCCPVVVDCHCVVDFILCWPLHSLLTSTLKNNYLDGRPTPSCKGSNGPDDDSYCHSTTRSWYDHRAASRTIRNSNGTFLSPFPDPIFRKRRCKHEHDIMPAQISCRCGGSTSDSGNRPTRERQGVLPVTVATTTQRKRVWLKWTRKKMTEVCPCCPPTRQNKNKPHWTTWLVGRLLLDHSGMIPTRWTMIYSREDFNKKLKKITFSNLPVLYHTYLVMHCPLLLFLVVSLERTTRCGVRLLVVVGPRCSRLSWWRVWLFLSLHAYTCNSEQDRTGTGPNSVQDPEMVLSQD